MLRQKLQNPPLSPLRGVGVVLGALAAAVLGSAFFSRLAERVGSAASLGFIGYGIAIAGLMMFRYVLAFQYEADDRCLRVSRLYGRYVRPMTDIWLNSVVAYGDEADVRKRYPGASVSRATRAHCDLKPFAMAHKSGGKIVITVVQPDDRLREHLLKQMKK